MKMLKLARMIPALALGLVMGVGAANVTNAAPITSFSSITNAGVFTLSAEQSGLLGEPTADRIGLLRITEGSTGDTFDSDSIFASVTSNSGAIIGLLNGSAVGLSYTGNTFDSLGETTLLQDFTITDRFDFDPGIYMLFNSDSGNIVFAGSSTFNGGQTRGDFEGLAPIPLPAAGWLLLTAFGGLGLAARRRRKAA